MPKRYGVDQIYDRLRERMEQEKKEEAPMNVQDTIHQDMVDILNALGLGDYARPISTHEVVQTEILPAIRELRNPTADPCPDCMHSAHANTDCGAVVGYDHLNGDHECGCVGEQRCDFDCDYCNGDEDEEIFDIELDRWVPVKSDICTCLAPGMNYCEVHDG